MPETIIVSDSILNQSTKIRLPPTDSITVSDGVVRVATRTVLKTLSESITVSEGITLQQTKQRVISETTTVTDSILLYKNGVLVVPVAPTEIPTTQNIIGTRERAVRATRRAPRAIVIDEIRNTVTAPLKLLAFSDGINKALVAIRPRPSPNVALAAVTLSILNNHMTVAHSTIKIQLVTNPVKARLALLSSSRSMWATARGRLKTRPEIQRIESLKAINADRIDKLHKLAMLSMMVESL